VIATGLQTSPLVWVLSPQDTDGLSLFTWVF
jgi:hypothetical protein